MPRITPVHWKRLECIFLKHGFAFDRSSGDHKIYVKKGILRPIVIPTYKEIDTEIIKSNLKTAGLSREDYFKLLSEC
ncbi:type II toxin-antitoxin system HicA family toxin [bacterium]|nr:type II toxin-antitoxin system HicA family toxin [bacterium]